MTGGCLWVAAAANHSEKASARGDDWRSVKTPLLPGRGSLSATHSHPSSSNIELGSEPLGVDLLLCARKR